MIPDQSYKQATVIYYEGQNFLANAIRLCFLTMYLYI